MRGPEAFAMVSTVAIMCLTVHGLAKAFFNRESRRLPAATSADSVLVERLERMEQAIQAIAIETERIAEGQRFTTRLLAQSDRGETGLASPRALESGRA